MATNINEKVNQYIREYNQRLQGLNQKLQDTSVRIQYLQMEVKMITENELPEAQTKALLEGTGEPHVTKLKKQLQKYQQELEEALENRLILQNGIKQFQINQGEEVAKLHRQFLQEREVLESKQYAKMMHAKKIYVDSLIEESAVIKEANSLDTKLQTLLVASGRKQQVYSNTIIKSNPTSGNPRFGGTYLAMTHQELTRFIQGTYTASDTDYLKKYSQKKDLT